MTIRISRMARSFDAAMQTGDFSLGSPPPTRSFYFLFFFLKRGREIQLLVSKFSTARRRERERESFSFKSWAALHAELVYPLSTRKGLRFAQKKKKTT